MFDRYEDINPVSFRVGDAVEIEFTFVGIPVDEEKMWFTSVMCGLTLLDNMFTRVSNALHI